MNPIWTRNRAKKRRSIEVEGHREFRLSTFGPDSNIPERTPLALSVLLSMLPFALQALMFLSLCHAAGGVFGQRYCCFVSTLGVFPLWNLSHEPGPL